MKCLIFGASGFIGHEAALALVRAGHDVYGITRSAETAKSLEAEEITPRVADPSDASSWVQYLADMDAVIDASGGSDISKNGNIIVDAVIAEAKKLRPHGPPLSYVYCSGTWLHGDHPGEVISDRSPITDPMGVTKWRLEIEKKATGSQSQSFTGNVVRPSLLYGTSGSLVGMSLFSGAKEGKITWYGNADARLATVHQQDVGEAFRLVVEKAYALGGIIFDISNPYPESLAEIILQLKEVSGAKEVEFKEPENDFQRALTSSAILRPTLAKSLLGWEARRPPLAQNMKVYYHAWLATQA